MRAVHGGAADAVVRMVLEQVLPRALDVRARIFLAVEGGVRGERFAQVDEVVLHIVVIELDPDTRGVGRAEQGVEVVVLHRRVAELARVMRALVAGDGRDGSHVIVHAVLNDLHVRVQLVHVGDELGEVPVRLVVVLHVEREDMVADLVRLRLREQVVERLLLHLGVVDIVEVLMQERERLLIGLHIRHVCGELRGIIGIGQVLQSLAEDGGTVDIEEPVRPRHLVEGAQGGDGAAVRRRPVEKGRQDVLVRAAVEDRVLDTEPAVQLRELGGLTVGGRRVTRFHAATEGVRHLVPEQEVPDECLGGDGVRLGQGVPVDDEQTLVRNQFFDAVAVLRADGEVVLEDNGTAVYAEVGILGLRFEKMNNIVHQIGEPQFALLGGVSPLPIPVCAADQVYNTTFHGGNLLL